MSIVREHHVLRPGATYATVQQVTRGRPARSLRLEGVDDAGHAFVLTVTASDWQHLSAGIRFMEEQTT